MNKTENERTSLGEETGGRQVISYNKDFWLLVYVRWEATGVLSREVAGLHTLSQTCSGCYIQKRLQVVMKAEARTGVRELVQ